MILAVTSKEKLKSACRAGSSRLVDTCVRRVACLCLARIAAILVTVRVVSSGGSSFLVYVVTVLTDV